MFDTIMAFAVTIAFILSIVFFIKGIGNKMPGKRRKKKLKKGYFKKALLSFAVCIICSMLYSGGNSDTTATTQNAVVESQESANSGTGRSSVATDKKAEITVAPTETPEPTKTPEPTATPTLEPTAEPTPEITPEPTKEPTPEPTKEPVKAEKEKKKEEKKEEPSSLEITMLDVGQGLSILINADGHYMLYDGGGRKKSSYVVSYLKKHGVTELDLMVASHYDEDHIAGLVGVLNTATVKKIIRPDAESDTKIYNSLRNMIDKNGAETIYPERGDTYKLGNSTVKVLAPVYFSDNSNNNSIVVEISLGKFSCIITGDAEYDSESRMVYDDYAEDCVLYVAGHHGSSTSTSDSFLKSISPEYCFISCGSGNSYGHPHEETMSKLKKNKVEIFRSDKQGEVTCTTDGKTWSFSTDPCADWTSGEEANANEQKQAVTRGGTDNFIEDNGIATTEGTKYVLNTSSHKIHYPSCSSVKTIADHNYAETTESRDSLIAQGYSPCKRCNP